MSDITLSQFPETGKHILRYCGDTLEVRLRADKKITGTAFLSTNIGHAALQRNEIISQAEEQIASCGQDWENVPMERVDDFTFRTILALNEEGHFECKACFVPEDNLLPVWVPGDNLHVNVSAASYCSGNSIYCAFVRQFGMNKDRAASALPEGITRDELSQFDKNNYSLIPPSGTFRDLIRELDHIVGRLRCQIIHLLPVNPTPTTFARMGRYGSPYASLDFTAVDPSLAEFDTHATPLDQFIELADAIHARNARLFIDIAINHTGWASRLQQEHPEWFVKEQNGAFHSPGAWGVVWGDLVEMDHQKMALWQYLAGVFLTWCSRGVDGFRCDAGYMIPEAAWRYIVARVRREYPETVFLLEGLGGDPAVTNSLLDTGNLDWAYSELFQNYSRCQVEGYLQYAWSRSSAEGLMVHYAETHDNSRLAAVSETYAKMRTALCALTSVCGAFGFANGVEWFAKEKIDVHESSALNWNSPRNQIQLIARLNTILAEHPCFQDGAMLQILDSHSGDCVIVLREDPVTSETVLVIVNLECNHSASPAWNSSYLQVDPDDWYDLITGQKISVTAQDHSLRRLTLQPGGFLCLSPKKSYLTILNKAAKTAHPVSVHIEEKRATAAVLSLICRRNKSNVVTGMNIPAMTAEFQKDPEEFLEKRDIPYVLWHVPTDARREVMIPPEHNLMAVADKPFCITVAKKDGSVLAHRYAIQDKSGRYFALIPRFNTPSVHTQLKIFVHALSLTGSLNVDGSLLLLAPDTRNVVVSYDRKEIYNKKRTVLQANGKGAILHQCMELEQLESRYNAILLANLNPDFPEDRHIMWRRICIRIIYRARLQELKHENLDFFKIDRDGGSVWHYHVPVGNGLIFGLTVKMLMIPGKNAVAIQFHRSPAKDRKYRLPDNEEVMFGVNADIEDRNFHCTTKAASGPEYSFPGYVHPFAKGFEFVPAADRILRIETSKGEFAPPPDFASKWKYMIWQRIEAERGLDPYSDLYCPGLMLFPLMGDEYNCIMGQVLRSQKEEILPPVFPSYAEEITADTNLKTAMINSMRQFIVARSGLKTVIAGYPWFLDWGRDTLIAACGLVAVPEFRKDVAAILKQFASFAEQGTIPNMISGGNASNRDTSDAPLWLFRAVHDYCKKENSFDFLQTAVRGKETMIDILSSLASGYMQGTYNGIRMDDESGLIFSPPHFTWMDTNYPAGTPREGYPVEIQALWYFALSFLAEHDAGEKQPVWKALMKKVKDSFNKLFILPDNEYLSDCLHCSSGVPAAKAEQDDHLRPNQLLAVTLDLITDPVLCSHILKSCRELLIPGAIRSLADRPCKYKLPVRGNGGVLLNDPANPYRGRYEGDEDTSRKVAYHNGTAWTWMFPSWAEAWYMTYGEEGRAAATAVLSSMTQLMDGGCITQLPEILDGDFPHTARGCDAQAWGMTEYYRVWAILHEDR